MKLRTTLIATTTAIATLFATPALAADTASAELGFEGTSPYISERVESDEVRFDVVGQFVNYEIEGELFSAEIPQEATGFIVTEDGVVFTLSETPVERTKTAAQTLVDADEVDGTTYTRLPSQPVT